MAIRYINPNKVIEDYKKRHPEYTSHKLTVAVYPQSYVIKNGNRKLETVQSDDQDIVYKESGRIYGYCRISRPQQSIDRQIRNINRAYPEAVIFQEAYTGTKMDRPVWDQLFTTVKEDDTIVFDSVSRMSRTADEGVKTYMELYDRGVRLVFIKEPSINTDTYKKALQAQVAMTGDKVDLILEGVNKYLIELAKDQIRLSFEQAEKEVTDLHQRVREGIETARLKGKQIGQMPGKSLHVKKKEPAKAKIKKYSKDFDGTLKDSDVMRLVGVARNTYYKYKRELRVE